MNRYKSILNDMKSRNSALAEAALKAYSLLIESDTNEDELEKLADDASVDDIKKYKDTVDKSLELKMQASAAIKKANDDVKKVTDEINSKK